MPSAPSNIVLHIAYDGSSFLGWQKTRMGPSVEETLQGVLEKILQHPVCLQAASRTDAGVHAEGQIVNFYTPRTTLVLPTLLKSLNALLPESLRVCSLASAPPNFHPTLDVATKHYQYRVFAHPIPSPFHRHFHWHIPYPLNVDAMQSAATLFTGTWDFSAFCNARKGRPYASKERTLEKITLAAEPPCLVFNVHGKNFLYKMVRTLVGTLVDIGKGKIAPEELPTVLASRQRSLAGVTAPAHGLTLKTILYPQEIAQQIKWIHDNP